MIDNFTLICPFRVYLQHCGVRNSCEMEFLWSYYCFPYAACLCIYFNCFTENRCVVSIWANSDVLDRTSSGVWFNSLFKVLSNILRSLEDNSGKLVARLTLGNDKICGKAEQFTRFWTSQSLLGESFKIVKI